MTVHQTTNRPKRRGAVIIEFVFCLPILGALFALILFFGWSMQNQQLVKAAARHSAWRSVRGPAGTTGLELRQTVFNNTSDSETINMGGGPDTTLQDYVSSVSGGAGPLAQTLVLSHFPRGSAADVSGHFPTTVRLWQKFQGSIDSQRARDGVEWRRSQATAEETIKDLYLFSIDGMLQQVPPPAMDMGMRLRDLYLSPW